MANCINISSVPHKFLFQHYFSYFFMNKNIWQWTFFTYQDIFGCLKQLKHLKNNWIFSLCEHFSLVFMGISVYIVKQKRKKGSNQFLVLLLTISKFVYLKLIFLKIEVCTTSLFSNYKRAMLTNDHYTLWFCFNNRIYRYS